MWKILAVVIAATLAACTLDAPATVDELGSSGPGIDDFDSYVVVAEDSDVLAASDCLIEDDCEYYREQTLAQCLAACNAGPRAIEAFCRVIPHAAIRLACWGVVYGGPVACSGFCYWYYTP